MDFLLGIFHTVLYQPLFNALVLIYQYIPGKDFGIAVIVLTILIRIVLYPLMIKSIRAQKVLSEIQPKIQEIQKRLKDNKEQQTREVMALYQKEKINPLGGCLPLLLQLPILIALYRVFWKGLQDGAMSSLYSFVPNPGVINPSFLGLIDLSHPSPVLAVIAGITQFFQSKMLMPKTQNQEEGKASQFSNIMQKQMLYFFPIFTVFILWRLPAAIGIYWIVTALFSIGQQYLVFKKKPELEHVESN